MRVETGQNMKKCEQMEEEKHETWTIQEMN